jgi:hypothetical protein
MGGDCYQLSITLRNGMLYFQAASPLNGDQSSRSKTIGEFADVMLARVK